MRFVRSLAKENANALLTWSANIVCRWIRRAMAKDEEARAEALLRDTIRKARHRVGEISEAYNKDWIKNPSTGIRAVLGYWMVAAMRHFAALTILSEEHDLSVVAGSHYRQMLEIQIQVRHFIAQDPNQWELLAQRVSAYGCIEYLEKLEVVKSYPTVVDGYMKAQKHLENYDQQLIEKITRDRQNREWYWFGKSFSSVAKHVSRDSEDLQALYQLQSADLHGSWGLTFGVANPKPGSLDFRGYPDKVTMFGWAAESVDMATRLLLGIWNDIAQAVGAPTLQ